MTIRERAGEVVAPGSQPMGEVLRVLASGSGDETFADDQAQAQAQADASAPAVFKDPWEPCAPSRFMAASRDVE